MKKFCKILAVIMAVMMMVTMATACKNSDEDFDEGVFGGNLGGSESNDNGGSGNNEGSSNEGSNNQTGNNQSGNSQSGNNQTGNNQTGNNQSGNNQSGNNQSGNSQSGNKAPTSQEQANQEYDPTKKYDMANNPLLYEGKKENTGFEVPFDIDTTGFVKNNVKVKDLKGKTFHLITAVRYGCWEFKNEKGEYTSEWDWFEACKSLYGLNVKYTISRFDQADQQILTYMNAGKQLDLVPTHVGGFPTYLQLSQALDPYINIQNLGNSPGICEMTLQQTKWGGTYRCISAIGAVNVLWYNQSLVEQFSLKDPHKLWQEGNWNWDTYEAFMKSIPKTTPEGKKLYAFRQCDGDIFYAWPLTNGLAPVEIDTKSSTPNLINNWLDTKTLAAWEFISNVNKSIQYPMKSSEADFGNLYTDGTLMMSDAKNMNPNFDSTDYGKAHKYNWVPFPAATTDTGRCIAFNYGYTMMLPKKMKVQANAPYAVKFMELWATRFTEALYDFYSQNTSIGMDYAAKKEHFEFCVKNTYFGVQKIAFQMITATADKAIQKQWAAAFENPQYNITTEAHAMKNIIEKTIKETLTFAM